LSKLVAGASALGLTSQAGADMIYSFRDLFSSSDAQNVRNYDNDLNIYDFSVDGKTPGNYNYDLGGLSFDSNGFNVTAYLKNNEFQNGGYSQVLTGAFDRGYLGVGGKPDAWIAVEKNAVDEYGVPYIGETIGDALVIAEGNRFWSTFDLGGEEGGINFNGQLNAYEQVSGCTSSGEIILTNSTDLIPEPTTSAVLLGAGALALAKRKVTGLVNKIFR
jgi:hypothetical protein